MIKRILLCSAAIAGACLPAMASAQSLPEVPYYGKPPESTQCIPEQTLKLVPGTVSSWYAASTTNVNEVNVSYLASGYLAETTCGPAVRYEDLNCVDRKTGATVSVGQCESYDLYSEYQATYGRRASVQSYKVGTQKRIAAVDIAGVNGVRGLPACPAGKYVWRRSQADTGSVCGTQQVPTSYYCVDAENGDRYVTDDFCKVSEKPTEVSTPVTSYEGCSYDYAVDAWTLPEKSCGQAIKVRTVTCQRPDGTTVADSFCENYFSQTGSEGYGGIHPNGDDARPSYQIQHMPSVCNLGGYSAILDECDATPVYQDEYSGDVWAALKPKSSQTFDDARSCGTETPTDDKPVYEWKTSAFTPELSRVCGTNTRAGKVFCVRKGDGVEVADSFCPAESKPASSEKFSDVSGCVPGGVAQCQPSTVTDAQRSAAQSCLSGAGATGSLTRVVSLGGGGTAYCVQGGPSRQLCAPGDWNGGNYVSNDSRPVDYVETEGQGVCAGQVQSCEKAPEVYAPAQIRVGWCGYTSSGGGRYACGDRITYRDSNGPAAPQFSDLCSGRHLAGALTDDTLDGNYKTPMAGKGWTKAPVVEKVEGARCVVHRRIGYSDSNQSGWQSTYFDGPAAGQDGLYISKK